MKRSSLAAVALLLVAAAGGWAWRAGHQATPPLAPEAGGNVIQGLVQPAAAGTRVVVLGPGFVGEALTGRDGRYALRVPGHGRYGVLATAAGGHGEALAAMTACEPRQPDVAVELKPLVLQACGSVVGRVVGPDGKPAAGAEVGLGGSLLQARADARGAFTLAGLPPGIWDLVAQRGGARMTLRDVEVLPGKPLLEVLPLALPAGRPGSTSVTITDAAGAPVAGAHVVAFADGLPYGEAVSSTDAAGHATLGVSGARLLAYAPGSPALAVAGGQARLAAVRAVARVSGTVTDLTGGPARGATVRLDPPAAGGTTDDQGAFALADVPVGAYTLTVEDATHATRSVGLHVGEAGAALDQPLRLEEALGDRPRDRAPERLRPVDIQAPTHAAAAAPAAKASAADPCSGPGDVPPTGFSAVDDLAAPQLGVAYDRAGHLYLQWRAVTQDPVPADPAQQDLDVRYDVQYYDATGDDSSKAFGDAALTPRVHMPGDGRWCPLDLYADNTLPINTTLFGYRLRVAAFGWKQGSERVYGTWSYAAIAGTPSSPGAGVPQKP